MANVMGIKLKAIIRLLRAKEWVLVAEVGDSTAAIGEAPDDSKSLTASVIGAMSEIAQICNKKCKCKKK